MNAFLAFFRLLSPARRRQFALTLGLMLLGAAAEMVTIGAALPFLALVADPHGALIPPRLLGFLHAAGGSPVVGAALLLIAAALGSAVVRLGLTWGSQRFVMATGHDMAAAVFGRMLRQPYAEQVRRNSSQTLAAVEKVQGVVFGLLQPAMQGLIGAFIALCVFALLLRIDARAAGLAAFAVGLVYVGVSLLVRPRLRRNSQALASTLVERTRTVQEGLGGIRDIILDRSEPLFEAKFRELDSRYRRSQAATQFVAGFPRYIVEAAGLIAIALVTLAMSLEPGGVVKAIPVLGALALGAQRLLPLLQQAYYGWSLASGNIHAFRDVIEMMEAPIPEPQPEAPPLPFERELAFRGVGFHFPEARFGLEDVSFRVRPGEHVGIAGPTGGGKSTLLDLLMGLLEPDEGAILVDGRPLDAATRPAWQAGLAHVPQTIYLADDTIAANIAFPRRPEGMDPGLLATAVRAAQLERFVAGLPDGLDTYVGERGVRLSGGQRQRIGLARALYRSPRLLILDEATSALDEATERAVLQALHELRGDMTLVTVAHRATTLAACDRLIRVEGGRVSEG
ncbi:MAG TPA: ABC transporter ATP-binding protein [Allosphingosinicella sp.]|jgi:ATP-binding cassette subfamily B protein|nr:ABC transporter ATP-binding protein [Allosphingosinicella sp.]